MIKAIILDCFGVLYQTPPLGVRPKRWWSQDVMGLSRNQELIDYTQGLRRKLKVGVLSNCAPGVMEGFFSDNDRRNLFDAFLVSSEIGLSKPQPEAYLMACQKLGAKPEECVFIDDIMTYINAAKALGIHTIHYKSNDQVKAEVERLIQGE